MKALSKAKQVERQAEGFWDWLNGGRNTGGNA